MYRLTQFFVLRYDVLQIFVLTFDVFLVCIYFLLVKIFCQFSLLEKGEIPLLILSVFVFRRSKYCPFTYELPFIMFLFFLSVM